MENGKKVDCMQKNKNHLARFLSKTHSLLYKDVNQILAKNSYTIIEVVKSAL